MNISFVPKACQGEEATFEGQLIVRLPSADERCLYMSEVAMKVDAEALSDMKAIYQRLSVMMKYAYDHVVKIDLVKKSDGSKITKLEELKYDPDCFAVMSDVATSLMNGFAVGKG